MPHCVMHRKVPTASSSQWGSWTAWASADITDDEYIDMMSRLGFPPRSDNYYSTLPVLRKALQPPATGSSGKADKTTSVASAGLVGRLMKAAFGIEFKPTVVGERGFRVLDFSLYTRLAQLKVEFGTYCFVDDEDPMDDPLEPSVTS